MSKYVLAGTAFICLSVFLAGIASYPGATGSGVSKAMASAFLPTTMPLAALCYQISTAYWVKESTCLRHRDLEPAHGLKAFCESEFLGLGGQQLL